MFLLTLANKSCHLLVQRKPTNTGSITELKGTEECPQIIGNGVPGKKSPILLLRDVADFEGPKPLRDELAFSLAFSVFTLWFILKLSMCHFVHMLLLPGFQTP